MMGHLQGIAIVGESVSVDLYMQVSTLQKNNNIRNQSRLLNCVAVIVTDMNLVLFQLFKQMFSRTNKDGSTFTNDNKINTKY